MADAKNISFETTDHTLFQVSYNPSSIKPKPRRKTNKVEIYNGKPTEQVIAYFIDFVLEWKDPVLFDNDQYLILKQLWSLGEEISFYPNPESYPYSFFTVIIDNDSLDFDTATGRLGADLFGWKGTMTLLGTTPLTREEILAWGVLIDI